MSRPDVDLLVAGGGPVGLGVALHARAYGLTVAVVEPRAGVLDKACGEGLMPSAVAELRELGVEPEGRRFVGIRYVGANGQVAARFRRGPGLGVRRTELHRALGARADSAGVLRVRDRVTTVRQDDAGVAAAGLRARYLVAADGLHSSVRRHLGLTGPNSAGADGRSDRPARFGLRRHFAVRPWTDLVEVHWSPYAEAYVTPLAEDLVGVAVLCRRGATYAETLTDFPALTARLRGAAPVGPVRGAGPLRQAATRQVVGRVLLVGDAAGYVDALTGEGISTGLRTARAAVLAVVANRTEDYPRAWRRETRRYRALTEGLLRVTSRPGPRELLVPAAARLRPAFSLAVNLLA